MAQPAASQGYFICQRQSGGKFACCERLKVLAICSVPKRWPWAAVSALRGRLERGRCDQRFDWPSDRRSGLFVVSWRA
ncbi:MAG: hypothetical protein WCI46_15325, partial [Verrucomicrobiota bacterium]